MVCKLKKLYNLWVWVGNRAKSYHKIFDLKKELENARFPGDL
jgi:hypothetical protein